MDTSTYYVGYQSGDDYWATYLYANDSPETRIPRLGMVMGSLQAKLEADAPGTRAIDYLESLYDESGFLRVTVRSEMANDVPSNLFSTILGEWENTAQEDKTHVSFNFSSNKSE